MQFCTMQVVQCIEYHTARIILWILMNLSILHDLSQLGQSIWRQIDSNNMKDREVEIS